MKQHIFLTLAFITMAAIFGFFRFSQWEMKQALQIQNPPSPYPSSSPLPLTVLASIPYWDQANAFNSFKQNIALIDKISLFWYYLEADGTIATYNSAKQDESIIKFAKENKVEVYALIANLPDLDNEGDWDAARVDEVISSKEAREKHINDLVGLVLLKDFDGLNLDYEALKREQREDFSDFVDELAAELHKNNKKLGVAIHPKTEEFKDSESYGAHAQDLERISKSADELYFMTYEEHNIESNPGPIASNDWTKRILNFALRENQVPNNKTFLGIPLYGYDWTQGRMRPRKVTGLEYTDVRDLTGEYESEIKWSDQIGESHFTYRTGSSTHEVWFNNARSVESKLKLRRDLNLGGIHIWRLGQEDPEIWEKIKSFKD